MANKFIFFVDVFQYYRFVLSVLFEELALFLLQPQHRWSLHLSLVALLWLTCCFSYCCWCCFCYYWDVLIVGGVFFSQRRKSWCSYANFCLIFSLQFLVWVPTPICHFFHLSIHLSISPSVYLLCTISQESCIMWSWFLVHV